MADENDRAVIGANYSPLADAIERFDLVGFMLARLETLACAVRDDRLDRACLKVLAALIDTMNRETRTSWVGRDRLGEICGISAKSAGNYIYQLKALGYIVGERRETPQANNRVLMHYTLAKLSPDEIEAAIVRAIGSIRGELSTVSSFETARRDGQSVSEVPAMPGNQDKVPVPTGKQLPAGTGNRERVPAGTGNQLHVGTDTACQDGQERQESDCSDGQTAKSARPGGCSNRTNISNLSTSGEGGVGGGSKPRASRLNPTNDLARKCGTWALENFEITRQQAFAEWQAFADFWTSKAGKDACKLDWLATWRNWVRNSRKGYKARRSAIQEAKEPSVPLTTVVDGWDFKPGDQ